MIRNSILLSLLTLLTSFKGFTQNNDASPALKISGYVDAYYAYYTDSVGVNNYQKFPSVSPKSNQFGINTALISFQYDGEKVRGICTLHFGDIARSAWSPALNEIMEAHAGVRLCKKLWLDAGLFRTHFGTEGLLPKENFASSISVNTYYEPYFEAGARLNYIPTDKLSISIYALNGYNTFEENNDKKSLGVLATYALGDKGNIGYCNYIGDDSPQDDSISHVRIHQNLFFNYQIDILKIQIGGDYCLQKNSELNNKNKTASMYSGVFGLKPQFNEKFAIYGRGEFFNDPEGFMSSIFSDNDNKLTGFKMWGITLGAEYKPTDNSYIRLEGRQLKMDKNQKIFYQDGKFKSDRLEMMLNMGISF